MLQENIVNRWASLDTVQQGIAQGTIYGIAQGIEQGILLGKEEGKVEGCLESLHPIVALLAETRFPGIATVAKQQAASIKDPEILKLLVDSLIVARTQRDAIRLFTAAISLNNNDF
jgi:flagellar biosynthesis/type III secretory pathway protein FliH